MKEEQKPYEENKHWLAVLAFILGFAVAALLCGGPA